MIKVYTDGASTGNPGASGAGIYIKANNEINEHTFQLGELNNHEAEFTAVIKALEICQHQFPNEILSIRSDAKVVVDSIEKNHTKNKTFHPLLKKINQLSDTFPHVFIKWIPERENKHADRLAKQGVQMELDSQN